MYFNLFEEFKQPEKLGKKKKKKTFSEAGSDIENYTPPEYVVQPAKDDKGFFMFKKAFDSMKKKFDVGFFST